MTTILLEMCPVVFLTNMPANLFSFGERQTEGIASILRKQQREKEEYYVLSGEVLCPKGGKNPKERGFSLQFGLQFCGQSGLWHQ